MKGDDDNCAELVALYQNLGPGLVRYLRRMLHSSGLAEDVAQDAFLILVRKWPDVRNHPCPKAWLYTVARHLAFDTMRERSHEFLKGEPPDQDEAGGADPLDSYNTSAAVREAVGKLPPRQREAVWLFYFRDFAQNEIATIMQIQRGAVGALLFQARSRLAGLLGWPDGEGQIP
jgi:RNA polymerase sigma-70 factor, ECF subfamily